MPSHPLLDELRFPAAEGRACTLVVKRAIVDALTGTRADDRVATVIVHYRNYADLSACLESIEAHDIACPIVVVDHACEPAQLQRVVQRIPRVHVVATSANPGFAAGVNRGMREVEAPYVLVLNPDCLLHRPIVEELADYLDRHSDVAIVGPRVLNTDGTVQPSARRFPNVTTALAGRRSWLTAVAPGNPLSRHNLLTFDVASTPRDVDWVSGACMMVRRTALARIGGLDESFFLYWEDADACRRLKQAGWRTAYYPGVSITHIGARCSRHNARAALVAFHKSALRYFYRHAGLAGRCASPLVAALLAGRLTAALLYKYIRADPSARSFGPEGRERDSSWAATTE